MIPPWPNPVLTEIHLNISGRENFRVEIADIFGQTLICKENQNTINLTGLNPGLYILTIRQGVNISVHKIIKN
jgi:hypothetical protein